MIVEATDTLLRPRIAVTLVKRRRTLRDHGRDLAFDLCNRLRRLVPAALQLAGDEPVGGIDGIVLAADMGRLVACLLQGRFKLTLATVGRLA